MNGQPPADIERQRALAAATFPVEWKATLALTGKRKHNRQANLRRRALNEEIIRPLRERGEGCKSCRHFKAVPTMPALMHCEADSDFYGYAITTADELCAGWEARK